MRPPCIEHTLIVDRDWPARSTPTPRQRSEPYPTSGSSREDVRVRFRNGPPRSTSNNGHTSRPPSAATPSSLKATRTPHSKTTTARATRSSSVTPRTPRSASTSGRKARSPSATPRTPRSALRASLTSRASTPLSILSAGEQSYDSEEEEEEDVVEQQLDAESDSDDSEDDTYREPANAPSNSDVDDVNMIDIEDEVEDIDVEDASDRSVEGMGPLEGTKLHKPPGEPGRPSSGGYNLKHVLGWSLKKYKTVQSSVGKEIDAHLDIDATYTDQSSTALKRIRQNTVKKFPWIDDECYDAWVVYDFVKIGLKYRKERKRRQEREAELEELRAYKEGQEQGARAKKQQTTKGKARARGGTSTRRRK
ncbi:hypothetical protein AAF712_013306 [Marasmius tenuissimus]|uniref:Uncharacterized protein n=1 Tax=Marasmius tenuissimus TaxID=585030 RepID=A0ABR2ZE75_9AGAR|nr:hypothetical protein PM082_023319 [Marasmius tenuissimus]